VFSFRSLIFVTSLLLAGQAAYGQLVCTVASPAPPQPFVRAEGVAELVGDIFLNCSGGTATAAGANVPRVTITVAGVAAPSATLAPNITSRIYSDNGSEAFLTIDEPTFEQQRACMIAQNSSTGTNGCGSNFVGVAGGLNYSGTNGSNPMLPNVYQGRTATVNNRAVVSFPNVPIDAGTTRRLRIKNVRLDATLIPSASIPPPIQLSVSTDTPAAITLPSSAITVGFVNPGIAATLGGTNGWTVRQCDSSPQTISISFQEGFNNAFKNRFIATTGIDNPGGPPRFEQFQRDLTGIYYTESGFFRLEMTGVGGTASAFQGGNAVGLATNGSRILLRVPSLPSGVAWSVPNRIRDTKNTPSTDDDLYARLVLSADGSGFGGGYAPEDEGSATTTQGILVYEVIAHDPFNVEMLTVPITVTYTGTPTIGSASISAGFASQYGVDTPGVRDPSTFLPVPRFNANQFTGLTFQVTACPVQITVASAIAGQSATIDGTTVALPAVFNWVPGSVHTLVGGDTALSSPLPASAIRFGGWSAGAGNPLNYVTPGVNSTVTANYSNHFLVRNRIEPTNSGSLTTNRLLSNVPGVGAVYWPAGAITVNPVAAPGFRFLGFTGALTGTNNTFTVNGTTSLVARFEPTGTDTTPPFGSFESPRPPNHTNLNGQVGVTAWTIDDKKVSRVIVYRLPVAADPAGAIGSNGLVYIGDATQTCKARPDIVTAYPNAVDNDCAGWGYAMLTYGLPDRGQGNFTLEIIVEDWAGNRTSLGRQAISVNNNARVKPIGTIDAPNPGQTIPQNSNFTVSGWILATPGKTVNASTIKLVLDGQEVSNTVSYGSARPDVAATFPASEGYIGGSVSGFSTSMSTAAYAEGDIRQVAMVASDNGSPAQTDGIGSRPYLIGPPASSDPIDGSSRFENNPAKLPPTKIAEQAPQSYQRGVRTGWDFQAELASFENEPIRIPQMGRVELHAGQPLKSARLITSDGMPVGSSLAAKRGVFYWHAPPAFLGNYVVELVPEEGEPIHVHVHIVPRLENSSGRGL
jgi:hypothetical protein